MKFRMSPCHGSSKRGYTYLNRRATLPRAINSVLKQSMSDPEIIVVDDGSRDNTGSWIHTIRDPRV